MVSGGSSVVDEWFMPWWKYNGMHVIGTFSTIANGQLLYQNTQSKFIASIVCECWWRIDQWDITVFCINHTPDIIMHVSCEKFTYRTYIGESIIYIPIVNGRVG
jgi:hypothetical protein